MTNAEEPERLTIDTTVSHSARIWNYWIGGKDNYAVDREVGDQILELFPDIVASARADRTFLRRAVTYLAGEAGIRQFLDIGTGLPTEDNTHEVAQRAAPDSKIVYVDNDPLVLSHAKALLTSTAEGATAYINADVHDPDTILRGAAKTLDLSQPVAITMLGILHFILDLDEARAVVRTLLNAVPSGSYLAIVHATYEVNAEASNAAVDYWNKYGKPPMVLRNAEEIAAFFEDLELLEPGVVSCSRWRPPPSEVGGPQPEVAHYCGIGRKP